MQSVHFNTRPVPPRSPPTFLNLLPLHLFSPPFPSKTLPQMKQLHTQPGNKHEILMENIFDI